MLKSKINKKKNKKNKLGKKKISNFNTLNVYIKFKCMSVMMRFCIVQNKFFGTEASVVSYS